MKVLGLIGFGYNPGAALVVDGRLVAHCEEERLTRLKGSHFMFPGRSAAWCLASAGLALEDVDQIAWAWDDATSPCIDAGDPSAALDEEIPCEDGDPLSERAVNAAINMGAYGGTAEASLAPRN